MKRKFLTLGLAGIILASSLLTSIIPAKTRIQQKQKKRK